MRRRIAIAPVLAISLLGGCGGAESESTRVAAAVKSFYAAIDRVDGANMCSLLSSEGKRELVDSTTVSGERVPSCAILARLDASALRLGEPTGLLPGRGVRVGTPVFVRSGAAVPLLREPGKSLLTTVVLVKTSAGWRIQRWKNDLGPVVVVESGCLACHRIGEAGNDGPGPNLTHVGSKLSRREINGAIRDPTAPMPSFRRLPKDKLTAVVAFLSQLR